MRDKVNVTDLVRRLTNDSRVRWLETLLFHVTVSKPGWTEWVDAAEWFIAQVDHCIYSYGVPVDRFKRVLPLAKRIVAIRRLIDAGGIAESEGGDD